MSTTIDDVIAQLQEAGLVPADKLAEFIPPAASPSDPKAWTAQLVERGLLTPFQATQIAQGKAKSLVIGDYEMVDRLSGGGGLLFKGRHRRMKRLVTIKPLAPSLMKAAGPRILSDVEAVGRLQHPNVLAVQDVDEVGGAHFLVAEFFEATDLPTVAQQQAGKLPLAMICSYAAQVAAALAEAHAQGVVHRDVKAENVLVDRAGNVKLLGFGLTTNDGDAASDVLALGQMLQKISTGAEPPPALKALLEQMTSADVAKRPAMADVAARLADSEALLRPAAAAPEADPFPELFAAADDASATPPAGAGEPVAAPVINVGPIETSEPDEEPAAVIAEPDDSPVIAVSADATPQAEAFAMNTTAPAEGEFAFAVSPSAPSSPPASKTAARKSSVKGKKSPLPFKIDPKYMQPKYLIGAGAGVVLTLSLLLWLVVRDRQGNEVKRVKVVPPANAVKAVPPKTAAPVVVPAGAFQLPPSDSLSTVRPSTAPNTASPPTARPASTQPETLFGLPITPAPTGARRP